LTALALRLPASVLGALLDGYCETLFNVVDGHGGIVSSIVGDGVMCVWTDPDPLRARRAALNAALDVVVALAAFNASVPDTPIPTRIGLHAGSLTLGPLGGGRHFAFSVVGDVPNVASRIEGVNKVLGTTCLASAEAVSGVEDEFLLRPVGRFRVVGRMQPLQLFEPVRRMAEAPAHEVAFVTRFASVMSLIEAEDWAQACALLEQLAGERPSDGPTTFHLARCSELAQAEDGAPGARVVRLLSK